MPATREWAPEQLEEEIEVGAWHIFPGDANTVFDDDPDSLWMRMIKKTETEIARAGPIPRRTRAESLRKSGMP